MANFLQKHVLDESAPAGADLSGDYGRFVRLSSGNAVRCTLGQRGFPLTNAPSNVANATESTASFRFVGVARCIAGAAVAEFANVTSDASGRAITAASGHFINGVALEAAGAAGDVISVLVATGGGAPLP